MKNYDHKKIEKKCQNDWDRKKIYFAKDSSKKSKFYGLVEFPYPSGDGLHVGHPRPYIGMDVISRKRRMEGYNVLFPMGWDAFGLPAENYAIKTGKHPKIITKKNSENFKRQIKMLGISFDWPREINTTDPNYYKWTQWLFLQFYRKGLAYKAKSEINWCPKDKIGLANEEAVGGICDRCGSKTEKRMKEQWMLAITKYADRLDKDLDLVDYPERVKLSQKNWIGKSEGSEIDFLVKNSKEKIKVFTTRADTIFGATYVVLAPEHELVKKLLDLCENKKEVENYVTKVKFKSDLERAENKEKTGVELKGVKAINPANEEEVPIWIADYVLPHYGTGAVMAVPAHDERDLEFAKKFNLPIKQVIAPHFIETTNPPQKDKLTKRRKTIHIVLERKSDGKILMLDWLGKEWGNRRPHTFVMGGVEEGEDIIEAAKREVEEEAGYTNITSTGKINLILHTEYYAAHKQENRYADISLVHFILENEEQKSIDPEELKKHTPIWISKNEIRRFINVVDGPFEVDWINNGPSAITEEGIIINSQRFNSLTSKEGKREITKAVGGKIVTRFKLRDWVFSRQRYWGEPIPIVNCKKCGLVPVPEKDLPVKLPEVKSYKPTDTGESPLAAITKWVNTKCPKCKGPAKRETDTMPNWAGSSWYYLRYTDPKNKKEFASKKNLKYWTPVDWYNGGMEHTTLHLLYSRFWHKFLYDLKLVPSPEPYKKRTSHGMILGEGGVKMSKSLGNVVNPDDIVKTYGADTLRVYEMFMGPFEEAAVWNTDSIIGSRRFIEKVWRVGSSVSENLKNFSGPRVAHTNSLNKSELNQTIQNSSNSLALKKLLHKTIKKVSEDIESMRFNTAISAMMILVSEMEKAPFVDKNDFKKFLQILAPFAPHVSQELWAMLGERKDINISSWPKYDKNLIKDDEVKIVIQVNGKVRAEMTISVNESEENIKNHAKENEGVKKFINGKEIRKIIYVKNRLVSIVI